MSEKNFTCIGCGADFSACSPDNMHPDGSLNKNDLKQKDIIEIKYKCKKCKIVNIIYWGFYKIPTGLI